MVMKKVFQVPTLPRAAHLRNIQKPRKPGFKESVTWCLNWLVVHVPVLTVRVTGETEAGGFDEFKVCSA